MFWVWLGLIIMCIRTFRFYILSYTSMWIPRHRNQNAYGKCRNPSDIPGFVSRNYAPGSREIVTSRTRHGAFYSFRRRVLRGGHIAWRILRSGTLEGPTEYFDPSAEGTMTTARPLLSIPICSCVSFCHRPDVTARIVTHSAVVV